MIDLSREDWLAHCWRGKHVSEVAARQGTILDALARQITAQPNAPAFSEIGSEGELSTLTFSQLGRLSDAAAQWLNRELGVPVGGALGLIPLNDLRSIVAILGALRLGASVTLLDPAAPPERHAIILASAPVDAVARAKPDSSGIRAHTLPSLSALSCTGTIAPVSRPSDVCFRLPTSGSTATSKIVMQTHQGTVSNAIAVAIHHRLGPGDRFLGCLPIHHVNGLHFTVMATLYAGCHALLAPGFDPFAYPRLLHTFGPRIASVVPSILQALLGTWRLAQPPRGFDYFVSAAAPLSATLAHDVRERLGVRVLQGYGLTEAINFSTTMPVAVSDAVYSRQLIEATPSIGIAVTGNEVAVLRPDGTSASDGEQGELCVRGHNIMAGYLNNPTETEHAFRYGWFHTGDLARVRYDPDLRDPLFVIAGRIKNVAKVRGESVSLEEMEELLISLPGISDAVCCALPDTLGGERIVAVIVADASVSDESLLWSLRRRFPPPCLPRRVLRASHVPRTATGKVLRPQVRAWVASLLERD